MRQKNLFCEGKSSFSKVFPLVSSSRTLPPDDAPQPSIVVQRKGVTPSHARIFIQVEAELVIHFVLPNVHDDSDIFFISMVCENYAKKANTRVTVTY